MPQRYQVALWIQYSHYPRVSNPTGTFQCPAPSRFLPLGLQIYEGLDHILDPGSLNGIIKTHLYPLALRQAGIRQGPKWTSDSQQPTVIGKKKEEQPKSVIYHNQSLYLTRFSCDKILFLPGSLLNKRWCWSPDQRKRHSSRKAQICADSTVRKFTRDLPVRWL